MELLQKFSRFHSEFFNIEKTKNSKGKFHDSDSFTMGKIPDIIQEIIDLEQVKRAYIHFLCSPRAKENVENYTQIENNKITIKQTLRQQYSDLQHLKRNKLTTKNENNTKTYYSNTYFHIYWNYHHFFIR